MCTSTAAFATAAAAPLRLLRSHPRPRLQRSPPRRTRSASTTAACSAAPASPQPSSAAATEWKGLEHEIEQARRERRPYRIDKTLLTQQERHYLRLRSKAIPLVADRDVPLDVVHEDDSLLVVAKPSFLKMHPPHRFQGGTLLNRAIGHLGFPPRIVHRLDMHTTGVVVLAKRKDACHHLMQQFASTSVQKHYLCVVDRAPFHPVGSSMSVDLPIGRSKLAPFMRAVADPRARDADAKHATTTFEVLAKSPRADMALLRAAPRTGRTHQIRVHAAFRGHPIVGDDLYNPTERAMYADFDEVSAAASDRELQRYGDDNPLRRDLMLHAWRLSIIHPETNEPVTYCAPPPPHMLGLLAAAGMAVPSA